MKVLMISKTLTNAQYRKKLEELGKFVDLTVVVPREFAGYKFEHAPVKNYRMIVKDLAFKNSWHLFYFKNMRKVIKETNPDIIHIDEEPFNLITYLTIKDIKNFTGRRIKIIFFTWQNLFKNYPFPFSYFERYTFRNAACAIAGSENIAGILRQKGFAKRIFVIPQVGIDKDFYKKIKVDRNKKFTIGYLGRLVKEKGIDILIRAVKDLDCRLLIVGEGPYKKNLASLIQLNNLNDKVKFIGGISSDETSKWLNQLDAFVLPSITTRKWKEQFGRVIIEAMACEVPVIGSNSGEIPHVIKDAGLIFREGDAKDLQSKILMLMKDKKLRNELAKRSRRRVLKHFTQKIIAKKTYEVYRLLHRD